MILFGKQRCVINYERLKHNLCGFQFQPPKAAMLEIDQFAM